MSANLYITLVCVFFACLFQDTIELLQARVSALDSATLDQVEARLQVTNPCSAYRTALEGKMEAFDRNKIISCNLITTD